MPRKAMEVLTEAMFYVLMALGQMPMCGIEIADYIEKLTEGRVTIGPATLYTILGKFEKEQYINEIQTGEKGRKRTYCITEKGKTAYEQEVIRLHRCIEDAERSIGIEKKTSIFGMWKKMWRDVWEK